MSHLCISSLVVQTQPAQVAEVIDRLNSFEDVEVLGNDEKGKLVVVLDTGSNRRAADRITEIQNQDGILSASLIYQYDNQHESQVEDSV
jgi:nitrate reductase NapAB chaperone NapD